MALRLCAGATNAEGEITTWLDLYNAISAGGTVTLTQNITAGANDSALTVPSGKTVTLDLNGHTLSRGLESAVENGYVILNNGTLTITDTAGGGTITGGNNYGVKDSESGNGGGIYNAGALTLAGGTITGNCASQSAGGVWNQSGGVFTMTGGTITGNTAVGYHGGGVYNGGTMNLRGGSITGNQAQGGFGSGQGGGLLNNGTLNVSGAPVVSGNTATSGNNIYMRGAHPIMTVTGELTTGANLYVTSASGTGAITSGYGTYNGSAYPGNFFHADSPDCGIALSDGEVKIATLWQITVATAEHGAVTPDKNAAYAGDVVTLTIEPEDGYWLSSIALYAADDTLIRYLSSNAQAFIMQDQDTVVKAEFKAQKPVSTDVLYPFAGLTMHVHGTLTADRQTASAGETVTLTLTTDEGYGAKEEGGMTVYKCLGSEQTAISVTKIDSSTWTFVMPDGDYPAMACAEIEWQNAPPTDETGPFEVSPYFYIDSACEDQGAVSTSNASIKVGGFSDRVQVTGQIGTLTATPDDGYVFAGWEVVAVNSSGEPLSVGYALPVEYVSGHYEMSFGKFDNAYTFRIRAIFEEAPQPIAVNVSVTDKPGTVNTGSTMTALPAVAYAGNEITLTVNLAEGAKLSAVPQIWYTSREANAQGDYTNTIEPTQDGNMFTFAIPQGISPNDPTIYITASFEDDLYSITVPDGWDEKVGAVSADRETAANGETVTLTAVVAGNVTFDPETDLHVSWTDGANQTQSAPVTVTGAASYTWQTHYTCTFTMPAHSVTVSADFTQKAYGITRADVSGITPAESRPETAFTVAGIDVNLNRMYPRADAGDTVVLSVTAPAGYDENSKTVVSGIYYTLDGTGERTDLALTFDEYLASSCSFTMPAGDITLHYETVTAYTVRINSGAAYGTFTCDTEYCLPDQPVRVTGTPDNTVYPHDRLACTVVTAGPDGGEIPVTVTDNGDGTFTAAFTAPAAPVTVIPEFQMENVPYLSYSWADGTLTCTQETAVRYFTPSAGTTALPGGLYVAKEDTAWNSSLKINGDVRLILMDGVSLTTGGVVISGTNTLTVYGQAQSSGQLTATASGENPGIALMEGGTLAVHGGRITAKGHDDKKSTKGGGAGIGGKAYKDLKGTLYVYSGTINATGGSALWYETETDHDGTTHNYYYSGGGAGIGGGIAHGSGTVVIYGGSVIAQAGCGAGIGSGTVYGPGADSDKEKGASVTILGGYVRATPRCLNSSGRWDFSYEAIGGRKSSGTLNLGENMIVKVSGGQYTGSEAASKCRSKTQVIISAVPTEEQPESPTHSIVFLSGSEEAEGSLEPVTVDDGAVWQVPVCGFTAPDGRVFLEWSVAVGDEEVVAMDAGDELTVTANLTVTAVWTGIPFDTPDFVIPTGVTAIEANAFEGIAATVAEIPANCGSIGDSAFKDCANLTMIRIPAGCALGTDVFDGCTKVYVFGTAGSPAEAYCLSHSNCVFVEEGQN